LDQFLNILVSYIFKQVNNTCVDIFDNDPFFKNGFGDAFGRMDKMIGQMRSEMMKPIEMGALGQGPGQRFS